MEETVKSNEDIYNKPSISKDDFISKLQLCVKQPHVSHETTTEQSSIRPKYNKVSQHNSPLIKHTIVDDEDIPIIDLQTNSIHMNP